MALNYWLLKVKVCKAPKCYSHWMMVYVNRGSEHQTLGLTIISAL